MDPSLARLLAKIGRPGWIVTGKKDETKSVKAVDNSYDTVTTDAPTGNQVLTIASPDGKQVDSIIVTPPPAPTPVGGSTAWPTDPTGAPIAPASDWQVVQGPQKEVPADATTSRPPEPPTSTTAALIPQWDAASSSWKWVGNPNFVQSGTATTPSAVNEAALNVERDQNAKNTSYGRVTNAELASLNRAAATQGRQLTNDERNSALSQAREDRLAQSQAQSVANQAATNERLTQAQTASNDIARQRLQLDQQKAAADAAKPDVRVIGNQLIDTATGQVRYTAPEGVKFQTAQDGTILLIDPANPTQPQVVWKPTQPPQLLPGQKPDQKDFIQTDPNTGALNKVPNPIYQPAAVQQWQSLQDGITSIQGMLTRGEIDFPTAAKYKDALQKNFDASLQGTTPYQQQQDKQAAALQRAQTGASLLNQRVSAGSGLAQSLVSGAIGIAGNRNFMDPSAVQGLSIFGGANNIGEFINGLGGGQGVQDAASGAVQQGLGGQGKPDYASALVAAALGGGQAQPQQAQQLGPPAYGGENIGSGAARNPQPPVIPAMAGGPIQNDPQFRNDQRHMPPQGYDPAAILLQAALAGGLQSF